MSTFKEQEYHNILVFKNRPHWIKVRCINSSTPTELQVLSTNPIFELNSHIFCDVHSRVFASSSVIFTDRATQLKITKHFPMGFPVCSLQTVHQTIIPVKGFTYLAQVKNTLIRFIPLDNLCPTIIFVEHGDSTTSHAFLTFDDMLFHAEPHIFTTNGKTETRYFPLLDRPLYNEPVVNIRQDTEAMKIKL